VSAIESAWPSHPAYRIDLVPCRGTVRVRVGDAVVAESTTALRLIETDHVERLYLPEADVRLGELSPNDHSTVCPFKGLASYWSHPDAEDLFWAYREPFPEVAGIAGYLGVYHEKCDVDIETLWADGTSAQNRFPAWGDEDDLTRLLDAEPSGPNVFVAPGYHERTRNVVEGGQLIGQAIVAAAKAAPGQRVTWVSMTFSRAADFEDPIEIHVEEVRKGRTFSTLDTRSTQRGKLVAPALVLLDSGAGDLIRHTIPVAGVPGPDECQPFDMGVVGRALRVQDGAYSGDPEKMGEPTINVWVRFRDNPSEPCLRQALIAQATTHWTIAAALLPHEGMGEDRAHKDISTGPVALSISFHDDVPVDQWLLYTTSATWSGLGLAHGDGRVLSEDGRAVASYSLQAMIRNFLPAALDKDPSIAM
jgi:uncharacterized protein (DUF427 family)/acyl-CoA thioesterase